MRKQKEYALYRGEEILAIGTIKEIAKSQNLNEVTIRFYKTPTYLNRHKNYPAEDYKVLIELEEGYDK